MDDYPYEYYKRKRAKKKAFLLKTAAVAAVFLLAAVLALAYLPGKPHSVSLRRTFCFVAERADGQSAEEIADAIASGGGAGYILKEEGAPVYACYYQRADAEEIAERLCESGRSAYVLERVTDRLYFGSRAAKKAENAALSVLRTLYDCSLVLYETANRLQNGTYDQSSARSVLADTAAVLSRLGKTAQKSGSLSEKYKSLGEFPAGCAEDLENYASQTVYASDIRNLQVKICEYFIYVFEIFGN